MNTVKSLVKTVLNLDLIIAGISTSIIIVITILGVFMRKVMGAPFPWIEEVHQNFSDDMHPFYWIT